MATVEAKRRRSANQAERLREAGQMKKTVWLTPEAVAALGVLAARHGGSDAKAINAALIAMAEPET